MTISNRMEILGNGTTNGAARRPFFQPYVDALSAARRVLHAGVASGPARGPAAVKEYRRWPARRGAKRRRPVPASERVAFDAPGGLRMEQILSPALDAMMSQMQSLARTIEAASQRVEEVSDKAEAAEQTALAMIELTALAAAELAAFAATDQARIIGFCEAPRRRNYEYLPDMDA